MLYKQKITFIIPVFYLSRNRERNFWFVYNSIVQTGCPVIVVEQKLPTSQHLFEAKIANTQPSNVKYYNLVIDDDKIHKSRLINYATSKATTSHVWVNDIDSFMYFNDILKTLNFRKSFIKPFDNSINTTRDETHAMVENRPCKLIFDDNKRRHIHIYGALSFIFNKKEFFKIGGMCEQYKGWGMEDLDLHMRVFRLYDIHTLPHRAVHLWHPPSKKNDNNFVIFKKRNPAANRKKADIRVKTPDIKKAEDDLVETIHIFGDVTSSLPYTNEQLGISTKNIIKAAEQNTVVNVIDQLNSSPEVSNIRAVKDNNRLDEILNRIPIKQLTDMSNVKVRKLINKLTDTMSRVLPTTGQSHDRNIIHVINYFDTSNIKSGLKSRVTNCIESIDYARDKDVTMIGCTSQQMDIPNEWELSIADRDSKTMFGDSRQLLFINDMLDTAASFADDNDFLLLTNSDCIVTPHIYDRLKKQTTYDVVEYHRRDIPGVTHFMQSFMLPYNIKKTGIDGFALRARVWKHMREIYPNMLIGEPHWDTVLSGMLHEAKDYKIYKNTTDLYHTIHNQAWSTSNLTLAGKHNTIKYDESLKYGMMSKHIIDLKGGDITIVIADRAKKTDHIVNYCETNIMKDIVVFEMNLPGETQIKRIPYINYITMEHNDRTAKADQTHAMANILLLQLFDTYSNFEVIFAKDDNIKTNDFKHVEWFDKHGLYDVYGDQKMEDFYMADNGFLLPVN